MSQDERPETKGERTRKRLFEAAVTRFREEGYSAASMRAIAGAAGVTPALLYRYFPSKEAIVVELYGRCLAEWGPRAEAMPEGSWVERGIWLTRLAFEVLGEYRVLLRVLAPAMLAGDPVASPLRNERSKAVVQPVFRKAVSGATDAPKAGQVEAISELLYLGHLALILFWVNDESEGLAETEELLSQVAALGPWLKLGLSAPRVGKQLLALSRTVTRGLAKEALDG